MNVLFTFIFWSLFGLFSNFNSNSGFFKEDLIPAFPGAEGFGKYTSGGRGGRILKVTNLNDSGPGSFREAINTKGPRTILFDVSGTIELKSTIRIRQPYLTIAGQTAPGNGITISNFQVFLETNEIIIRFLRFRLGENNSEKAFDAMDAKYCRNIIIDHCSFSWGLDETASFLFNKNFTLQWSIISEALNVSLWTNIERGDRGYGSLAGGNNVSFHHNLYAHNNHRNPRFADPGVLRSGQSLEDFFGIIDFRNNIIYNWGGSPTQGGAESKINFINNYFKNGPATNCKFGNHLFFLAERTASFGYGYFFINGNIVEGYEDVNKDNWKGVIARQGTIEDWKRMQMNVPFDSDVYQFENSAEESFRLVLEKSGSSLSRDIIDKRIVEETKSGTYTFKGSRGSLNGIIDSQNDVGGWPQLKSLPATKDSDKDGIPDIWEIENGLDPNLRDDRFFDLHPHYTNLEVYLNSLVDHIIK
ncbi:pectate lyase family protein [Aquiflexum lacus]|uniref:pectate lyase family protein n=1 Tax=Aquiflexum lacus TaxID=2483805 RepID=UPI001892D407|nr:pectate lyase [Aquiflexum lacus]